ncbi:hypothetical protein ASD65_10430 [Microbacterium sp. Root61]|uniref:hypothetical protein n=1 Tax=Microbacterium sp. Root61 TaxID=1736570 RepID=UPI0006FDAD73|nr:hypothetical protein [Microbacterium sp. Root61]KRA24793.1 hypothetical protein ASD65_10430 [Microbacterium sp. Root61]
MRQSRAPRVARGLVAASVATFIALLSHVASGGAMPGWLGVGVPWMLSAMVCTLLAGRRLSLPRLSVSVAASQLLFHTLFVLGTGGSVSAGPAGEGHVHGFVPMAALPGPVETVTAMYPDSVMWAGHGVAAIITVIALFRGERALARLISLAGELRAWVKRTLHIATTALLPLPVAHKSLVATAAAAHVPSAPRRSALHRRGPPLLRVL